MSDNYRSREERRRAMNDNKQTNKSQGNKKRGGIFRKIVAAVFILGIIGLIAGVGTFFALISDAPKVDDSVLKDSFSSKIYANDGKTVLKEVGGEKRTYVQYDEIPQTVKNAFIATEDVRFYKHHGIDFYRIGGAVVANFKEGFGSEGASTITQQVVKNSFLSPEKTVKRKVQEMWLSYQLERKYSKQQILEMYLNKIYFSTGEVYGIAKAAETFYGVTDLNDLTIDQAAMLAGLPKAPSTYNPYKNPENATKRRNTVLNLMAKNGFITQAEADKAKQVDVQANLVEQNEKTSKYDVFIDQVIEEVQEKTDANVSSSGLEIYTTLDVDAQDYVDQLMNNEIVTFPNDKFQAGLVVLNNETGAVEAIGGGRNRVAGGLNFATDIERQPGSTIKPVLDYGPAVEYLKWSTAEPIKDEPHQYSNGTQIRNYSRNYKGWVSAREALGRSLNIPALKAFQAVGADKAQEFGEGLGLELGESSGEKFAEAFSIGGFTKGVTPMELAGAYSAFANEGMFTKPYTVTKVKFSDGTELDLSPKPKRAMQDYTAFMVTDMMKSVVEAPYGTARAVRVPGLDIAGKTGTSNFSAKEKASFNIPEGGVKDVWFSGFTPKYTVSVWTGYEKNSDGYIYSENEKAMAKNIFKQVITHVSQGEEKGSFKQPDSVVKRAVEKVSSKDVKKPSGATPKDSITYEYFVRGTEPTKVSQVFVEKEKEKEEKEEKEEKAKLTASFSEGSNAINVNWSGGDDETEFTVNMTSSDGASQTLADKGSAGSTSIPSPTPGATYSFILSTNNAGSASASVKVPQTAEEEPEDDSESEPGDEEQNPDEGTRPEDENENDGEETDQPDSEGPQNPDQGQHPDQGQQPDQGETENSSEPPSQPGNNGNNGNGNNGTNGNGQGNNQQPPATPDQQTENE
ncbi:PBP1A family penicillin-binding protein [Priestia flexa]|uniref:transglycosylase domain-containing protein n=1 Tax=Priestia flexa TaxID=86664 RepID=UPI0020421004|nr:PBP1A family penicillin-binding protein [Priestia flexa]MCM3065679.1 PBP1A family penicillin-binding protein [Priestia flexa]